MTSHLLHLATIAHGEAYAALLRADLAIHERKAAGLPIPQEWRKKRLRLARELQRARAEYKAEWLRCQRESDK